MILTSATGWVSQEVASETETGMLGAGREVLLEAVLREKAKERNGQRKVGSNAAWRKSSAHLTGNSGARIAFQSRAELG